jgi:hypothetical protein
MGETDRDRPSLDENTGRLCEYTDSPDSQPPGLPLRCPSCGCRTLGERDGFEICPVCFWEDDGQDDHDADVVRGGPNGSLSLTQARANYLQYGACEKCMVGNVRPPRPYEMPEQRHAERGNSLDSNP